MVVFTLDYPTTPVFTHIILSSLKFIQFYFIHLEAARMNSGKHQKLWQAHRPTFFDVLIPCFFFNFSSSTKSISCPVGKRARSLTSPYKTIVLNETSFNSETLLLYSGNMYIPRCLNMKLHKCINNY